MFDMYKALCNCDLNTFMDLWITAIANIPYDIPVDAEGRFHLISHFDFWINFFKVEAEYHTNRGRIDQVIVAGKRIYILEYKRDATAMVALNQIKGKQYYQKFLNQGNEVILLGVNYSTTEKQITDWIAERLSERGYFIEEIHPDIKDPREINQDSTPKSRKRRTSKTRRPSVTVEHWCGSRDGKSRSGLAYRFAPVTPPSMRFSLLAVLSPVLLQT